VDHRVAHGKQQRRRNHGPASARYRRGRNDGARIKRYRQAALDERRGIGADDILIYRIQEVIVVVVYAPEYLVDRRQGLQQHDAPDLIVPEVPARAEQTQGQAGKNDR
jgi:hypothetical protein